MDCEVLEVNQRVDAPTPGVGGPSTNVVHTTLTWTLTETQNGGTRTRLHVEQSGFESAAKQAIGEAHYGWQRMLEQLQKLLVSNHRSRGE